MVGLAVGYTVRKRPTDFFRGSDRTVIGQLRLECYFKNHGSILTLMMSANHP
jgi:hypothetical protein